MIRFKSVYCMNVIYWLNCDTRFWLLPSRWSISKECGSRDLHYLYLVRLSSTYLVGKTFRSYNLLRWKDYDSEHDVWRSISELQNAKDLIQNYAIVMINVINLFDQISRNISTVLESSSFLAFSTTSSVSSSLYFQISNLRRSTRTKKSQERD
jgi:hypothetical protein